MATEDVANEMAQVSLEDKVVDEIYTSELRGSDESGEGTYKVPYKSILKALRNHGMQPFPVIYQDPKQDSEAAKSGKLYDLVSKAYLKQMKKKLEKEVRKAEDKAKHDAEAEVSTHKKKDEEGKKIKICKEKSLPTSDRAKIPEGENIQGKRNSSESCCDTEGGLGPAEITMQPKQRCIIKLSSGEKFTHYTKAGRRLLERDFKKFIDFENQKQTEIIVSPPEFIYKRPDLPHRSTKKNENKDFPDGLNEKLCAPKFHDLGINLKSEDFEAEVFYSIKKFFQEEKSLSKEIAIIQGWKEIYSGLTDTSKKEGAPGDEYDLIIIDGCRKFILLIEAKQTLGSATLKKALKQTGNQIQYFKKFHGYLLDEEWIAFPVIVCQNKSPSLDCSTYVLTPEALTIKGFGTWWNELGNKVQRCAPLNTDPEAYLNLLGRVIGLSLQCELFIGTSGRYLDWSKESLTGNKEVVTASQPSDSTFREEKKKTYPLVLDPSGEKRILFFLSDSQKQVLTDDTKRVILRGNYGTGKSLLLKIKAIQLAKRGEKVAFVVENNCKLFYELTKADFDEVYNKDIDKWKLIKEKSSAASLNYRESSKKGNEPTKIKVVSGSWREVWNLANEGYNVFSDEILGKDSGEYIFFSDIQNLEKIKPDKDLDVFIWLTMACNRSNSSGSDKVKGLEEFEIVDLKINFRNSSEIYRMLEQFDPDASSGVKPCRENLLKPNVVLTRKAGLIDAIIKALSDAESQKIGLIVDESILHINTGLQIKISKQLSKNGWKVIELPKDLLKLSSNDEGSKICFMLGNNDGANEWYGIEVTNMIIVYQIEGMDESNLKSSSFEDFLELHRTKVGHKKFLENLISRAVVHFTMVILTTKM